MKADTINIIKLELSKESPDVWRRVRKSILNTNDETEIIVSRERVKAFKNWID